MKKQRIFTKKHFAPLLILVAAFLLLATPKVNASAASKKPGAVTGFTAKSDHDDGGIKLKWKKVRHAKYYEIYWKKSKKGKFERYWNTAYTTGYGFGIGSDFQLGKTYYFKVRAVNGNKKGKFSPVKSAKAVLGKPFLDNLSLKSENSVSIKIAGYGYNTELYRATSKNGKYSKIKTFKKSHSYDFYTDANLLPGEYFYKARSYKKVKGKKIYSKFSSVKSIIVPKKVEITMDNWMQYYEVSPCNSEIYYNAFGEIECLYHQHTLQLKNNYTLHDSHYNDIAKSSIAVEAEYTVHEQEAIIDWQTGKITPGAIVSDEYTCTKTGSISENDDFYFMNEYLSKSYENPTIETIENVTMKRIQGTIYLDKW